VFFAQLISFQPEIHSLIDFLQTESALTVQQNFENTHRESLSEVRKCIQERDFIGVEFKKIQTRLNDLESSKTPLLNQQQQLEHHIQQITEKRNLLNQQLALNPSLRKRKA